MRSDERSGWRRRRQGRKQKATVNTETQTEEHYAKADQISDGYWDDGGARVVDAGAGSKLRRRSRPGILFSRRHRTGDLATDRRERVFWPGLRDQGQIRSGLPHQRGRRLHVLQLLQRGTGIGRPL